MTTPVARSPRGQHLTPRRWRGVGWFLLASLLFAVQTICLRRLSLPPWHIGAIEAAFTRFAIGFVGTLIWSLVRRQSLKPAKPGLVLARGLSNTVSVLLFYAAFSFTTAGRANILGQLFPAFMFLVAPLINREPWQARNLIWLGFALGGSVVLGLPAARVAPVTAANGASLIFGLNLGDLLALISSLTAAFALSILREARKHDETSVIIVWLFGFGMVATGLLLPFAWVTPPDAWAWTLLLVQGVCAWLGQVSITEGYRWLGSMQGSLILAAIIPLAVTGGVLFLAEPLTLPVVAGSGLALIAVAGASGLMSRRLRDPAGR